MSAGPGSRAESSCLGLKACSSSAAKCRADVAEWLALAAIAARPAISLRAVSRDGAAAAFRPKVEVV
eukprot:6355484-Pyramimonas_sp.AAC.1